MNFVFFIFFQILRKLYLSFQVYEIQVTGTGINPDPVVIASNDVVAWTFKGLRQHDVVQVSTVDQLFDAQFNSPNISPR